MIRSLLKYNSNIQIRVIFVDKPKNWYIDPYVVKDERVKYIYLNSFFKANKIGVVALKKNGVNIYGIFIHLHGILEHNISGLMW